MAAVGIIAEFNPLHSGHAFLLNEAKKHGTVVAVISGDFVQRGDIAIVEKRVRAKAALHCGADLVLELPVAYSLSAAPNFALGGVSALKAVGCDRLMFGSESGNISELSRALEILNNNKFPDKLSEFLDCGMTFAAAREKAAVLLGLKEGILSGANNNLAIEYMLAAKNIGAEFEFLTVRRQGSGHDSPEASGGYASASLIREKMLSGDCNFAEKYIPEKARNLFTPENTADIKRIEKAVLAVLRAKTLEELKTLPDISEGIENKLFSAIGVATDLNQLYNTVKVKRYTMARIRRLVLSAFIGIDNSFFMKKPPYVRVLGFNPRGEALLREKAADSDIPIILRVSQIERLSENARKLFAAECRASDLFALALPEPLPCGREYTSKLIKTEC